MPDVSYLNGGEEVTAERLNTLYAEADRRASLALDNHSILYLIGESADTTRNDFSLFLGPTFIFKQGNQPISGYWGTWSYDHDVFERALQSASELDYPNAGTGIGAPAGGWAVAGETQKWVRINPIASSYWTEIGKIKSNGNNDWRNATSLLRFSLEAHKRPYVKQNGETENFWIDETYSMIGDTDGEFAFPAHLQRIRQFEQAEIIFEGKSGEVDFPAKWNKYLFLRFHNINSGDLTISFRTAAGGIVHILTVPAYGSRCVRRTSPEGAYTDGYNHFQKFLAGDPRFYQHSTPNNVANPSILIPFVNRLLAGRSFTDSGGTVRRLCVPMALLDPHVRAPLPSGYGSLFAGATDGSLLGDNLHHKGTLKEVDASTPALASLSFAGYGTLSEIVETQESGNDLQIKSRNLRDLIAFSTNLICTQDGSNHIVHPVIDGADWFTLDRHLPDQLSVRIAATETESTVTYHEITSSGGLGAAVNQTITRTALSFQSPAEPADTLRLHADTIAGAKTRYFDQCNSAETTLSTTATLSAGGLAILTTQTIPLSAPFIRAGILDDEGRQLEGPVLCPIFNYRRGLINTAVDEVLLNHFSIDGQNLVIKRAVVFTGYGFPDCDNWVYTGFLTPRHTRVYSDCSHSAQPTDSGPHPDFDEGYLNADGEDIKLVGHRAEFKETEIQILSPRQEANNYQNGDAGILPNNDVLFGATKNAAVAGYWTSNRERLLQNRIYYSDDNDGSAFAHNPGFPDARQMYRFVRMEMAVEHYNNLAAKVNSITRIRRLNWVDHGVVQNGSDQTVRYRLRPNRDGIFERILLTGWYLGQSSANRAAYLTRIAQYRGMRPATQYAGIVPESTASTDEQNPVYVVAGYAGIPVKTISDLPNNFATRKGLKNRLSSIRVVGQINVTDQVSLVGDYSSQTLDFLHRPTGDMSGQFTATGQDTAVDVRPDLNALTKYFWLDFRDVQNYAQSRGYRWRFTDIGVGHELFNIELSDFSTASLTIDYTSGRAFDDTLQFSNGTPNNPLESYATALLPPGQSSIAINQVVAEAFTRFVEFGWGSDWIAGTGQPIDQVPSIGADVLTLQIPAFTIAIPRPSNYSFVEYQPDGVTYARTVNVFHGRMNFSAGGTSAELEAPAEFLERNWTFAVSGLAATVRNPAEYTSNLICKEPLVIGMEESGGAEVLIKTPVEWISFTPEFSLTSPDAASARKTHGPSVIPFTVEPADGEASRVQLWADFTEGTG